MPDDDDGVVTERKGIRSDKSSDLLKTILMMQPDERTGPFSVCVSSKLFKTDVHEWCKVKTISGTNGAWKGRQDETGMTTVFQVYSKYISSIFQVRGRYFVVVAFDKQMTG